MIRAMPNERDAIARLFRRALQPHPDPEDVERDAVESFVSRAMQQRERRELRRAIRAVFARLVLQLCRQGWTPARDGKCAECANVRPHHPFWSKLRPQYVMCPRGHRVHVECLHLRTVENELDVEALCPRCLAA
jgi:hypothetical protein